MRHLAYSPAVVTKTEGEMSLIKDIEELRSATRRRLIHLPRTVRLQTVAAQAGVSNAALSMLIHRNAGSLKSIERISNALDTLGIESR